MLTNQRLGKVDKDEIENLERFTRRLYIYRQKDRLQDEGGNGKGEEDFKNET